MRTRSQIYTAAAVASHEQESSSQHDLLEETVCSSTSLSQQCETSDSRHNNSDDDGDDQDASEWEDIFVRQFDNLRGLVVDAVPSAVHDSYSGGSPLPRTATAPTADSSCGGYAQMATTIQSLSEQQQPLYPNEQDTTTNSSEPPASPYRRSRSLDDLLVATQEEEPVAVVQAQATVEPAPYRRRGRNVARSYSWDLGEPSGHVQQQQQQGYCSRREPMTRHRRKRSHDFVFLNDNAHNGKHNSSGSNRRPRTRWLIPAEHPLKLAWDLLTIALSFANAYATHQAIRDRQFGTGQWKYFCDVWFVVDLLLNFATERPIGGGVVLTDFQAVWARYLTTWFVVDALSLVPGELLYMKPVIEQQNRRGFFKKSFFRTKAVIRVTRVLRGHHVRIFGQVARQTKRGGMGASRLLRMIIKYVPRYMLFLRNMKGVVAVRVLRQVHWLRKVWFNFVRRTPVKPDHCDDDDTLSLTDDEYYFAVDTHYQDQDDSYEDGDEVCDNSRHECDYDEYYYDDDEYEGDYPNNDYGDYQCDNRVVFRRDSGSEFNDDDGGVY